jgi:hypothetical protein
MHTKKKKNKENTQMVDATVSQGELVDTSATFTSDMGDGLRYLPTMIDHIYRLNRSYFIERDDVIFTFQEKEAAATRFYAERIMTDPKLKALGEQKPILIRRLCDPSITAKEVAFIHEIITTQISAISQGAGIVATRMHVQRRLLDEFGTGTR